MTAWAVDFQPLGRRGECGESESLLACAGRLGVGISSVCGGNGACRTCKVQVVGGAVSSPTASELEAFTPEQLKLGWRLACQARPGSDCRLTVPPESMTTRQRVQVEGAEVPVEPEPAVRAYPVQLAPPSLAAPGADADRVLEVLHEQHGVRCEAVDIRALRLLSGQLRSWGWRCEALVRAGELIAVRPPASRPLGLAVDLGTTKLAGYLVDLSDGRTLAAGGVMNPQIRYGEDVISRITRVLSEPAEAAQVQAAAAEAINQLCADLCAEAGVDTEAVAEAVVVGNTAMHHLVLGLAVGQLALAPFVPTVREALDVKAGDLGLRLAPGAYVHLLPNIAGFVGADHVAMLLGTEAWRSEGPVVALDIGTNTEVSLVRNGELTAVSCASGPAFEGGHIKHGMRAATGAIERLRITAGGVQYETVDQAPPIGICGSGILDCLSELYLAGVVDEGGRLQSHPRVRTERGQREFVVVAEEERDGQPAITITQRDVRELQLAKAAIRAGIQVLLEATGCDEEQLERVIIAGAFGTYIDVASAITIGMLPALPLDRFWQAGNAAGMGARLALISLGKRAEARAFASRVEYIELAGAPSFQSTFMQAGYLGRYRLAEGTRQAIE